MGIESYNNALLLGFACVFILLHSALADEGKEAKPTLTQQIDLKRFLRSYNYVDNYEDISKKLSHDVLAYITPWNSEGYDIAKMFAKKFTIISPVWFQLKPVGYEIDGVHNIDKEWMKSVKSANNYVTFAPRVIFEQWNADDYQKVLTNNGHRLDCIKSLRNFCKIHDFKGLTLEVWNQHFGTSQQALIDFLIELAKGLHVDGKILILPIPPSIYKGNFEGRFGKAHFDVLVKYIDYFSLMTYDYSNPYSPGENAPLKWMIQCVKNLVPDDKDTVKRAQILTGINFYGYDYIPSQRDGRTVVNHEVVDIAKKFSPEFKWHTESSEHSMEYTDEKGNQHSLYFPTIYSIAKRISMVEDLGTGLSIWEIGQGFKSFYEQI